MNVVGIYGSPRKGGNSDIVLDKVLEGAASKGADIRKIYARELAIEGCRECGGCDKTGSCVVKDDMQDVYPILTGADIIVLSSPVFFYGVTAQAKALIDRCQALWSRRQLNKTKEQRKSFDSGRGYLVMVGATKGEKRFVGGELTAYYFYDALDMSYEGGLFFTAEEKGEIAKNPDELKRAFDFGVKAVQDNGLR